MIKYNSMSSVLGYDNDYYPKQLEDQKVMIMKYLS